jgi:hypothetical protein
MQPVDQSSPTHPISSTSHTPSTSLMPSYKGFIANILNPSTALPFIEHGESIDSTTDMVTTYIETTPDEPFSIVLRDTTNTVSQGTAVYVDGVYIDNGLTGPGIASERRWFGKRIDHVHVKPFIFRNNPSGISVLVKDVFTRDGTMSTKDTRVGTISLILRRCHIGAIAEDQTDRGSVPQDMEPPNIRHLDSKEDYLTHRAEYDSF